MAGPLNTSILGLSLLVFLTACSKEGPKEPLAPRVYVQQVSTRDLAPPIQLSGDIQARVETQALASFGVGGKIGRLWRMPSMALYWRLVSVTSASFRRQPCEIGRAPV